MKKIYKKNLGKSLIKFDGNFYIYDRRKVFRVNEIGARVFELCNGDNSIENICKKIYKKYDVEESILLSDIIEFIDTMEQNSIIKLFN